MKYLVLAALALLSLSAQAACENVPIPDGDYSGESTWSDNQGAHGFWRMSDVVSQNGHHHVFTAQFDDGRTYAGEVDVEFQDKSHYKFRAVGLGHPVIGQGTSSPQYYENIGLRLSAHESVNEWGSMETPVVWQRRGTVTDHQTGRVTFIKINMRMRD